MATSDAVMTAHNATIPSTDRSMEPINITKVAPMTNTNGIAAALATLMALDTDRKFGLNTVITRHSRIKTPTGAKARQFKEPSL